MKKNLAAVMLGQQGGKKTLEKYGREHFVKIAKGRKKSKKVINSFSTRTKK